MGSTVALGILYRIFSHITGAGDDFLRAGDTYLLNARKVNNLTASEVETANEIETASEVETASDVETATGTTSETASEAETLDNNIVLRIGFNRLSHICEYIINEGQSSP
jgi:uncharacterized damage-inducible protein DinB